MATIPVYSNPQVTEQTLQGGFQRPASSSAAFGSMQAAQLQDAAEATTAIVRMRGKEAEKLRKEQEKLQEQEDADVAFRTETALKTDYLEFQDKLRQERRGANAKNITVDAEKWWTEAEQKYTEGLNDRQKRLVGQTGARLRLQSIDTFRNYEIQERDRSEKESWSASKASEARIAISNPRGEVVSASIAAIRKKNAYMAGKEGWTPEVLSAENLKDTTTIHKEILNGFLKTGNVIVAREYYEGNQKEIDPTFYDTIDAAIKTKEIDANAVTIADSLIGMTYEQGLAKLNEIPDAATRDKARQRFKENITDEQILEREREAAKAKKEKRALKAVWQDIANGRKPKQTDLDNMGGLERIQVNDYFEAKAKAKASKNTGRLHAKQDNYQALDMAESMIKVGDITDVNQLERFAPFLEEGTYRSLRKSVEKRGEIPQSEVEKSFIDSIGKPRAKWENKEYKEWIAYQDYINTNVKETKRPEDLDAWRDRWFRPGYRRSEIGDFFPSKMTMGQAKTQGVSDFLFKTPKEVEPFINEMASSMRNIKKANPNINIIVPSGSTAGDELYTNYYKDATVWFSARNEKISGPRAAAYAILRQNNKPITSANINAVISEMKGK